MQIGELELLAPAKNKDIGIAAINCGADALYIAGPSFGAREAAGNTMQDIEALATYAHRFGANVYMTLNTILFDNEIEKAERLSFQAYEAGCDALIIQDLGLLKAKMPSMPLFASTQTNIRTVEQAKSLESLGFKRLILARELSLTQIREIKDAVNIELEFFIHGALCVSYSGQCYLSARATGRSANRGICAQACRSNYNLVDSNGKILVKDKAVLSLKDLNLSEYIPELINAGITSFKIEGRLKNASYVKNIVKYYRSLIDGYISSQNGFKPSSSGKLSRGFTPRPELTFNRGFTDLFVSGKRGEWQSRESAKSLGEYIGKVEKADNDKNGNLRFSYTSDKKIQNGDGLCFITQKGKVIGARASTVSQNLVVTNEQIILPESSQIYRNYNIFFEKELEQNMPKRLIDVELKFYSSGSGTNIKAISEDGCMVEITLEGNFDLASNIDLAQQNIYNQLNKTAEIYKFNISHLETEQLLFYPASALNEARRELAVRLNKEREEIRLRKKREREMSTDSAINGIKIFKGLYFDYRANISNKLSKGLYESLGAESIEDAYEISLPKRVELMRCKYCIKYELNLCPKEGVVKAPDEPLFLENNGRRYRLGFDCKNCEMVIFG